MKCFLRYFVFVVGLIISTSTQEVYSASVQDVGTYYPGQQKILTFPQSVWGNGNKVGGPTSSRTDLVEVWDWNTTGATLKILKGVAGRSTKVSITVDYYDASKNFKRETYVFSLTVKTNPIEMTESSISMRAGETHQLSYKGTVSGKPVPDATWTTSNSSVATVGFTGIVTAKSAGRAEITATSTDGEQTKCIVTVSEDPTPTVTASPGSGLYEKGTKIYLSASMSDATIRYTTDGSTPTVSSREYSSYLTINESFTLKARAYNSSGAGGEVLTCEYTLKGSESAELSVTASPGSGLYDKGRVIRLSASMSDATIRYTTDGSTPTVSSREYSPYLFLNESFTLKARAYDSSGAGGEVLTCEYTVKEPGSAELSYHIISSTDKTVEVAYYNVNVRDRDIVIPKEVKFGGVTYTVVRIGDSAFSRCDSLTSITIPTSVTSIGERAFYDCASLTSITIPTSVTSIGERAFVFCSSLTSITIPNSVTAIGEEAFFCCGSLMSIDVDIDNQTYSSNDGILYDKSQTSLLCCPGGKSGAVIIPTSVTSIGDQAFYGCDSLTSITIPTSVTSIGEYAFGNCASLTSIILPTSVTTIGSSAFYDCNSLTSITIPTSVTSIGERAFVYCSSLTSIILPNTLTYIGKFAFYGCSSLTSITSLAVTPPECGSYVFKEVDKQKCTLYVPAGSKEAYQQAPEWKDFVLVEAVEAGIDSVAAGSADGATEVFNLTGAKVADTLVNLPAGIYLVREGSTIRKIAVR